MFFNSLIKRGFKMLTNKKPYEAKTEAELLADMKNCASCQSGLYTCASSRQYLESYKHIKKVIYYA